MTTIIEKTSSSDNSGTSALAIVLLVCLVVGVGVVVAYMNGFIPGHTTVIEKNNTTIEHTTTVVPAAEPAK